MRLIPAAVACLLLPLFLTALPITLTGCGGDRYACDDCAGNDTANPNDSSAEDPEELLATTALNVIESAQFTVVNTIDPTTFDDFGNYTKINFQFGTYSKATLNDYDKDNEDGNLMPIAAELWDDTVKVLDWAKATSNLDNIKLRSYYAMDSSGSEWTLNNTDNNQHELRLYDKRIYEVWLGWTIKWELFKAHEKGYVEIASKDVSILSDTTQFSPPILADINAQNSFAVWGDNQPFTGTSDTSDAAMFVFYKQFRPVDKTGKTLTVTWVAAVPQNATNNGDTFVFSPIGTELSLDEFINARTSQAHDKREKVNEKLYVSFGLDGNADLWNGQLDDSPAEIVPYTTSADGSFIRINIPMADKVAFGLETYENPIFVLINDGINDGVHLGWLYEVSGELAVDNPQPHYAFNDVAYANMKKAFKLWRRESYCDDSSHRDDVGRDTLCAAVQ